MGTRAWLVVLVVLGLLASALTAFAIVDGNEAKDDRYPWIAQIRVEDDLCAGSLVRPQWIVTAAHCVTDPNSLRTIEGAALTARVGSGELDRGGELREGDWIIPYPDYDGSLSTDLALVRLDRSVSMNPVRLVGHARATLVTPGDSASVAGWGSRHVHRFLGPRPKPSRVLFEADVRIAPGATCEGEHAEWPFDARVQLCTTADSGETCKGDSGGPLFLAGGADGDRLIGVTQGGDPHCKPGHGNRFARLAGGDLRSWLDEQLAAAGRPLTACPDELVRHSFNTHTIRHLRSNTGCPVAGQLAAGVSERDECVEETSGGVNTCTSGDFTCATRIANGPAGVAFISSCVDGTRRIAFRQGATAFSSGPPFRLRFDRRGFPIAIGPFDIAAGDRSIADMIDAFGLPDSTGGDTTACTVTWGVLGLTAYAVDYGAGEACDPSNGLINTVTVRSPRFVTDRGAVVGISAEELRARHPQATTKSGPGDAYFDGEPAVGRGDLYTLHTFASPIGLGGFYSTLKALVTDDSVVGFEVTPLLGGD